MTARHFEFGLQSAEKIKDLSGKDYRFDGKNEGIINGEEYLSITDGIFGKDGILRCTFTNKKLPKGFTPQHLSLSNSSTKSSSFAQPKNAGARNFYSVMNGSGIIRSARIYTFPDYPDCILTQVGTAELSDKGIFYHTFINGFTEGMPIDIVKIHPYTQYFERQANKTLTLRASTELICSNGEIVRGNLTGQFTFQNLYRMAHDFTVTYSPKFVQKGNVIDLEMPVSMAVL